MYRNNAQESFCHTSEISHNLRGSLFASYLALLSPLEWTLSPEFRFLARPGLVFLLLFLSSSARRRRTSERSRPALPAWSLRLVPNLNASSALLDRNGPPFYLIKARLCPPGSPSRRGICRVLHTSWPSFLLLLTIPVPRPPFCLPSCTRAACAHASLTSSFIILHLRFQLPDYTLPQSSCRAIILKLSNFLLFRSIVYKAVELSFP